MLAWALIIAGLLVLIACGWGFRRTRQFSGVIVRRAIRTLCVLLGIAALLTIAAGGYLYWLGHRTQPIAKVEPLFNGIIYHREIRQSPRPMVIHIMEIDLRCPDISFIVTPGEPTGGRMLKARKTSDFLREFKCQAALNANYFYPFRSESPLDFYPHTGDPVDLCGYAASRGQIYSNKFWMPGTLFISQDNKASFDAPEGAIYNAIAGNGFLVADGKVAGPFTEDVPYPRCALGLDRERRIMRWFIIDGKQPHYSEGATLSELAVVMVEHDVWSGVRIDEGGSSTMVCEGKSGPRILNSTINHRIPHWERVVANHLGVYSKK